MRIPRSKDFWAGILFLGFGVLALVIARNYTMGSAVRMGPGYFPTALGWILTGLGVIIGVRGLLASEDPIDTGALRPFLVLVAILAFALALDPLGLVVAIILLIGISALAGHEFHWLETIVLTAILLVVSLVVFVWGLGLQFKVWPWS
jgi:putative tricarboxylic transport membrane protein